MKSDKRTESPEGRKGISRRKFLKGAGLTSVGVAVGGNLLNGFGHAGSEPGDTRILGPGPVRLSLIVNGKTLGLEAEPRETLAEVLRDRLHLTGTKISCDRGACGACTVLVDNMPVCSCSTLAHDVAGSSIETVEGVMGGDRLSALQEAFIDHDGLQCGFCTPGMVMSCRGLLHHTPHPSPAEVRNSISGNLCRCGTYPKVIDAVLAAAGSRGKG